MTNKELFLNTILAEISTLQEAYNASKNLPDRVFDTLYSSITNHDIGKYNIAQPIPTNGTIHHKQNKFSGNKGVVYDIIFSEGRAIRKRDILIKFQALCPKVKTPVNAITFALSGLRTDNEIRSYNPTKGVKSGYWTLKEWWEGDKLLEKYLPSLFTFS
jgi:hypothetical protein